MRGGQAGIGMKKHARSGIRNGNGKSPRFKHWLKRELNKIEIKGRAKINKPANSLHDLLNRINGRKKSPE